jgi:hypothetical protein
VHTIHAYEVRLHLSYFHVLHIDLLIILRSSSLHSDDLAISKGCVVSDGVAEELAYLFQGFVGCLREFEVDTDETNDTEADENFISSASSCDLPQ